MGHGAGHEGTVPEAAGETGRWGVGGSLGVGAPPEPAGEEGERDDEDDTGEGAGRVARRGFGLS